MKIDCLDTFLKIILFLSNPHAHVLLLFLMSLSGSSGNTLLTTSPCHILQLTECALIEPPPSPSSAGCGYSRDRCEIQREHLLSRVGAAWWNTEGAFSQPGWWWLVGLDVFPLWPKQQTRRLLRSPTLPNFDLPTSHTLPLLSENYITCPPKIILVHSTLQFLRFQEDPIQIQKSMGTKRSWDKAKKLQFINPLSLCW